MELTLTKTKTFELEPFGKFNIKFTYKPRSPRTIPFSELSVNHETSMPFTKQQEKDIIKLMVKNKTDILTDGSYLGFYTRVGGGEFGSLAHVAHPNLVKYRDDEVYRDVIDNNIK